MKKAIVFVCVLCSCITGFAQQTNPTNNKELQDKINQAQQQLNNLTPEQKKLMQQMGMSTNMPSNQQMYSDEQISLAVGGDAVPKKNQSLINAIPKIPLTATTVDAYVKSLNAYVEKSISENAKTFGQQVYDILKENKYRPEEIGNVALGYWINGDLEPAVFLMSKACSNNSADDDMLSNYAAMLSMGGAPHRAIPVLEYLLKKYPDNTTIQNNLGQAWFYLGEIDKANDQLDKVVKAFAYHPQANYTQCLIQESKGNKTAAIEKMKNSLHYSYSLDKVNKLRKLGYSVKASDMRIPFRPDPDPLGLRKFMRPDVPTSYEEELRLIGDWDAFQKQAYDKSMELGKSLIPYQQANAQQAQKIYNQYKEANSNVFNMKTSAAAPDKLYSKTAEKYLEAMNKDGGAAYRLRKAKAEIDLLRKDFAANNQAQRKKIEKENSIKATAESEDAKKGEDIGFDNCVVQKKYSEWVYTKYNKPLEEAYKNYLHQLYLKITEELYWKQFVQDDASFEATKIAAQKEWLSALYDTRYIATNIYGDCQVKEVKSSRYKLADFDEMHCKYISVLDFGVYKQIIECGKMHVEFNAGGLSGKFNFKQNDKGKDQLVKGNIEAVLEKGISTKKGPLQIGATVKAGMGLEFTSRGVEDWYATGEASINVKSNFIDRFDDHIKEANGNNPNEPGMGDAQLSDKGVEIGVNGRVSLISGNTSSNIFVNTPN